MVTIKEVKVTERETNEFAIIGVLTCYKEQENSYENLLTSGKERKGPSREKVMAQVAQDGWFTSDVIYLRGKAWRFKSQKTNIPKYLGYLTEKGLIERRYLPFYYDRNGRKIEPMKHKKKGMCWRLKRDPRTFYQVYLIFFRRDLVPLLLSSDYFRDLQDYALLGVPKGLREEFLLELALAPEIYAYKLLYGPDFQKKWDKVLALLQKRYPPPLLQKDFIMIVHALSSYIDLLFNEEGYPPMKYHDRLEILEAYITNKLEDFRPREEILKKTYMKTHQEVRK